MNREPDPGVHRGVGVPAAVVQVIVTRPAAQAAGWVRALSALGQPALALPLIEIIPAEDPAAVHAAWRGLDAFGLVLFVSANAVAHFFAAAPGEATWPAGLIAGSTGPGTSAALRDAGVAEPALVEPAADAAEFDSESLWARLQGRDWVGRQVLVVRGEAGRDWLAETLRAHGAEVEFLAAYSRRPPRPGAEGLALIASALAQPAAYLWHFSSSEAIANLCRLAPAADWSASAALASHSRIAQTARSAGFGRVVQVPTAPDAVAALVAEWPSIQSAPP